MLRKLVSRIVQTLTPIGLSVALIATGCVVASESGPVGSPTEHRAGADGPSAAIVAAGEDIAEAIVADPAFDQLVGVAAEVMGDLHGAQQELSDEELEAIALTTSHPSFPEVMGPGALLTHLGGDPQHLNQMQALVDQIRVGHGLQEASTADVRYVFELAIATDEAQDKLAIAAVDELGDELGDLGGADPCEQLCHNAYVAVAILAIGIFVIELAVILFFFPWGLILMGAAIAQLNLTLAQAQAERDECLAACDGIIIDLDVCGGASVCDADEYCWEGPLGFGADECRSKKELGKVCSSDDKCQSGCCKYHFPSNPVSLVCRPSNKCN